METAAEWYDKVMENGRKNYHVHYDKIRETDQGILVLKSVASKFFEQKNPEEYFTFRHKDKFGFNERLVNVLMQAAYNLGSRDIAKESFECGYKKAQVEMVEFLGFGEGDY